MNKYLVFTACKFYGYKKKFYRHTLKTKQMNENVCKQSISENIGSTHTICSQFKLTMLKNRIKNCYENSH